jgi:hypothetical protein
MTSGTKRPWDVFEFIRQVAFFVVSYASRITEYVGHEQSCRSNIHTVLLWTKNPAKNMLIHSDCTVVDELVC